MFRRSIFSLTSLWCLLVASAWSLQVEQIDAQERVRHVSNRGIKKNRLPAEVPVARDVTEEESEVFADPEDEAPSRVVQASCKNCQSNQSASEVYSASEGEAPLVGNSFSDHDVVGCDGGGCVEYDQCGDCVGFGGLGVCGGPCGLFANRLTIRAESGFFWGSGQGLPSLVTSNDASIFGGGETGTASVNGFRSDIGWWFDDCKTRGALVRMFYGGDNDLGLMANSTTNANLELPYLSLSNPRNDPALISVPDELNGSVNANLSSNVYGGDLLMRTTLFRDHLLSYDWLVGYQTARLSESLSLDSTRTTIPPTLPADTTVQVVDRFHVKNQLHGATLGMSGMAREGNWYFGGLFKLGVGNMARSVEIAGNSTTTVQQPSPNPPSINTTDSGLLASSRTNSGRYNFDTFVVSPELNLTVGYRLTHRLDFTVGYNMLRLPKVTRVTDALDPLLAVDDSANPTQINPEFRFRESNFTLHSLNLGLQWQY